MIFILFLANPKKEKNKVKNKIIKFMWVPEILNTCSIPVLANKLIFPSSKSLYPRTKEFTYSPTNLSIIIFQTNLYN